MRFTVAQTLDFSNGLHVQDLPRFVKEDSVFNFQSAIHQEVKLPKMIPLKLTHFFPFFFLF